MKRLAAAQSEGDSGGRSTRVPRVAGLIAFALVLGVGGRAQVADTFSMPAKEYSPQEILETWGWLLGEQFNLVGLDLTPSELETIARGMAKSARGEQAPHDVAAIQDQLQVYFAQREERILKERIAKGRAEESAFFDQLMGKEGIQSLGSGLFFEIIEPGSGERPEREDWVRVHYRGTFLDGEEFDSSYQYGEPSEFKLDGVIEGWSQGLRLIGEGGKIKLYVPARLAYGDAPRQGIPPASTLIFDVELLKVLGPNRDPSQAAGQ